MHALVSSFISCHVIGKILPISSSKFSNFTKSLLQDGEFNLVNVNHNLGAIVSNTCFI